MSQEETCTDVVELCALLQCLGYSVKSLDASDASLSQDGVVRTVVISCQSSGLHVVLENTNLQCSCPTANQHSGFWQVSGVAGGKQLNKESGSSLLGSIPKIYRERLSKDLRNVVRCIKDLNESDLGEKQPNRSASMVEITPEKSYLQQLKADTPTRYRSLDTLTSAKSDLPVAFSAPGPLQNQSTDDDGNVHAMCHRQSTYTISSTPGSARRRNKTSSPIQPSRNTTLDTLIEAEKTAEDLRNKLTSLIKNMIDDDKNDSSMSSLALDVSKISILKASESTKAQFASSPNLSKLSRGDTKSGLKRFESASTSNLNPAKTTEGKSMLRRISPNIFKRKDGPKDKIPDSRNKLQSLFKPKIITPVRVPKPNTEASPNLSSSRKKFSHIKSTIPRPTPKKE